MADYKADWKRGAKGGMESRYRTERMQNGGRHWSLISGKHPACLRLRVVNNTGDVRGCRQSAGVKMEGSCSGGVKKRSWLEFKRYI